MAAEVTTSEVAPDDRFNAMLEAAAGGKPWVFIYAYDMPGDGFGIKVETGGGVRDVTTIRNLLTKTLKALEDS